MTGEMLLRSIKATGEHEYEVEVLMDGEPQLFGFVVDRAVVPVVMWETDFRKWLGGDVSAVRPLFAAVLAFDEARNIKE